MRECRRCKITKPFDELKKDSRNKDGYSSFCKLCHRKASVEWQSKNKDKVNATRKIRYQSNKEKINELRRSKYDYDKSRTNGLKRLYKVSEEWYNKTLSNQNNKCAICQIKQEDYKRKFVIDHNHSCCKKTPTCGNCNRGLLCHTCNVSLASIETTPNWGNLAERYLNEFCKNT